MSIKLDRQKLKTFFETGDRPTEKEFINFIDSMIIQEEDEIWVDATDPIKKVGIGTDQPKKKLDVNGDAHVRGTITVEGHIYGDKSNIGADKSKDAMLISNGASLQIYGKQHPTRQGDLYLIGDQSDNGSGKIVFSQKIDVGWRNNMVINTDGNVGVGTMNPEAKLDLKGDLQLSGSINGKRTGGELSIFSDRALGGGYLELKSASEGSVNQGGITFVAQGDGRKNGFNFVHYNQPLDKWGLSLRINGEGDVGIGTANPEAKLDLRGDFQLSGSINGKKTGGQLSVFADRVAGGGYLELKSASEGSTNAGGITFVAQGDGTKNGFNFVRYNQPLDKWGLSLRINGEGNVGIGTDDPKNKLHINVNSNDDQDNTGLRLTGQNGWAEGQLLASDADGNAKWVDKTSVTSGLWQENANGSDIFSGNTGNVGIGVNTPSERLEVGGNISLIAGGIKGNSVNTPFNIHGNTSVFNGPSINFSGKDMGVSERGAITFVANNSHQPQGTAANPHERAFNFVTNGESYNWNSILAMKKNGNVGIGIHSPDYKLDVNGDTNFRGDVLVERNKPIVIKTYEVYSRTNHRDILDYSPKDWMAITTNFQFDHLANTRGSDFNDDNRDKGTFVVSINANTEKTKWTISIAFPRDQNWESGKWVTVMFIRRELVET
jgi:hypothetical protein